MKVVLIYDCPEIKCSKLWVLHELRKQGYEVLPIYSKFTISYIEQRGQAGKILARVLVLWQAIKGINLSHKEDIVFCWNHFNALYFNLLTGSKRKIISYNWLTPTPRKKTLFLYQKALRNPNLAAVVNYEKNKQLLLQAYQVEDTHNIFYIPDVYDDSIVFAESDFIKENRYIFMGGRANRDWKLFLEIAKSTPDINYVGVAAKSDWKFSSSLPKNLKMFFDLDQEEYYKLMVDAYMAIYPLEEDKVSGLVNIVKAIQMGKLIAVSNLQVTSIYYPDHLKRLLITSKNSDEWKEVIEECFQYNCDTYRVVVKALQEHLKSNFSPSMAGEKLQYLLKENYQNGIG